MRDLVDDLISAKISRRQFLAGMSAASFTTAAAQSALDSVAPFIPGSAMPEMWLTHKPPLPIAPK